MTQTYSPRQIDVLLAQMTKSLPIMRLATERLDAMYFPSAKIGGSRAQGFMFHMLSTYFKLYKNLPDGATLVVQFEDMLKRSLPFGGSSEEAVLKVWLTEFMTLRGMVEASSEQMARDIIAWIHRVCVFEAQAQTIIEQAQDSNAFDGIGDQLKNLEEQHKSLAAPSMLMGNFDLAAASANEVGRTPTGCAFLDSRLGRGKGPGSPCAIGIIGPQGGGKTTLGIQMTVQQALHGRHSVLLLAENGSKDVSLQRSIIACATGISSVILEDANGKLDVAAAKAQLDYDTVMRSHEALGKFLHIVDVTENGRGCEALAEKLTFLLMSGARPAVAYVDWAGIIADRMVQLGRAKEKYDALQSMSYEIAGYTERFGLNIFISQQMAPMSVLKGPFHINDQYCAADCKSFTAPFKYVMVLNPKHEKTGIQLLNIPKARNDESNQKILVRHTGVHWNFVEATGYELKGKSFVSSNAKNSEFSIPAER